MTLFFKFLKFLQKFLKSLKVANDENYLNPYVSVSFVNDDEIRRKSIELFYQMINHEIEQTTNIEQVRTCTFLEFFSSRNSDIRKARSFRACDMSTSNQYQLNEVG